MLYDNREQIEMMQPRADDCQGIKANTQSREEPSKDLTRSQKLHAPFVTLLSIITPKLLKNEFFWSSIT